MLLEIIKNIPWYVYLILYILIKRGIKAMHDQKVPPQKLFILPVILLLWSLYDIYDLIGITHLYILVSILIGISSGIFPGIQSIKNKVQFENDLFITKGNPATLILILSIFIFKLIIFSLIGYTPSLIHNSIFIIIFSCSMSFIAGIALGRLSYCIYIFGNNLPTKHLLY